MHIPRPISTQNCTSSDIKRTVTKQSNKISHVLVLTYKRRKLTSKILLTDITVNVEIFMQKFFLLNLESH